ncbi:hypothetical protein NDU88_007735, partial [Pleurodeles waltl]
FSSITFCSYGRFFKVIYIYVCWTLLVVGIYRVCRFIKNPRYPEPINELHLAMGF